MGRLADFYEELFLEELFGKDYKDVLRNSDLSVYNDARIAAAFEAVINKIDALSPDLSNPQKAFSDLAKKQHDPEAFQQYAYDADANQKFGNNITTEQYKKNLQAMLKYVVEPRIRMQLEWVRSVKRLGLSKEQEQNFLAIGNRWAPAMMHIDGSKESRDSNDELTALLAYCSHIMSPEQFRMQRIGSYASKIESAYQIKPIKDIQEADIEASKLNLDQAIQNADNEASHAPQRILDLVRDRIEDGDKLSKKLPKMLHDVLHGNLSDADHTEAFKMIGDRSVYLAWAAKDMADKLKDFGLDADHNMSFDEIMRGQEIGGLEQFQMAAEMIANPYFVLYDPFKEHALSTEPMSSELTADPKRALHAIHKSNRILLNTLSSISASDTLQKYAIGVGDEIADAHVGEFHVFQTTEPEKEKGFLTSILKINGMKNGHAIDIQVASPEEYVNCGFQKETASLVQGIAKWEPNHKSSKQFEDVRKALTAMNGKVLPEKATQKDYLKMKTDLQTLFDASDLYLTKKDAERSSFFHIKTDYENKRYQFVQRVKEFAEKKLQQIDYSYNALNTIDKYNTAERDFANVDKGGLSGLAFRVKQDEQAKAQRAAEAARAQAAAEEKEKAKKTAEENHQKAEAGVRYHAQLQSIRSGLNEDQISIDHKTAKEKVSAFSASKEQAFKDANGAPEAVEAAAKEYLAAKAIEGYIDLEAGQKSEPKDWTIHELVNAGKIPELFDFFMHSDALDKEFASAESRWKAYEKKTNFLGYGPRNGYYVAKNIDECIKLSKEAMMQNEKKNVKTQLNFNQLRESLKKSSTDEKTIPRSKSIADQQKETKQEAIPDVSGRRSLLQNT